MEGKRRKRQGEGRRGRGSVSESLFAPLERERLGQEMTLQCLLPKPEGLSSDPQKLGKVAQVSNSSALW